MQSGDSVRNSRSTRLSSGGLSSRSFRSKSSSHRHIAFAITEDQLMVGPKIGHGGYGDVFEAKYLGTHVAVKKLHAVQLTDKVLLDFKKECSIMKKLRHPNLVLFMGSCNAAPTLFLVTELMVSEVTASQRTLWFKDPNWLTLLSFDSHKNECLLHFTTLHRLEGRFSG